MYNNIYLYTFFLHLYIKDVKKAQTGNRTQDLQFTRLMLYHLAIWAQCLIDIILIVGCLYPFIIFYRMLASLVYIYLLQD